MCGHSEICGFALRAYGARESFPGGVRSPSWMLKINSYSAGNGTGLETRGLAAYECQTGYSTISRCLRSFLVVEDRWACCFALGSNKIANSSNTIVYVGVTIFVLCGLVGVLVGFEATGFLSATGVGHMIAVASSTSLYCALPDLLHFISPGFSCSYVICRM